MSFSRLAQRPIFLWTILICLLAVAGFYAAQEQPAYAAPAACGSGVSGNLNQDTTWSGAVYIDGDVTVQNSTLTIEPGTDVIFCGSYRLRIGDLFDPARLLAEGTAAQPIHFTTADGVTNWEQLAFGDHLDGGPSLVKHVIFENGGGADPNSGYTITVADRATVPEYATPLFQQVTVRNSNGSGFDIDAVGSDPTPPELTGVLVENSARYPLEVEAPAVQGLLSVSGSGNLTDTIRVVGGNQGTMEQSQRWRRQTFPYEVDGDVSIIGGNTSTWTIDPGVELRLHPDVGLSIGNLFTPARLQAKGTITQPITITAATDQHWGQIYFSDHLDQGPSLLQHVTLENGGGPDPLLGQTIKVSDRSGNASYPTPLFDHVTVRHSNGYGIDVEVTGSDPTPPQLTNVTIENSSLAPVNVDVNAVGGIGPGFAASGNSPDHIRVQGNELNFDSRWRSHGLPYEVVDGFAIRSNYPDEDLVPAVWSIDPGVTILMHPGTGITIGSLYGEAQLLARGTGDAPITFTRLDGNSAPWDGFGTDAFNGLDSEFTHVNIEYGGGSANSREAVFLKRGSGSLLLENSSISHSQNGAIWVSAGKAWVKDSAITYNRYGLNVLSAGGSRVTGSDLSNNAEFALQNSSPNSFCVEAVGNYWGPGGPLDSSAAEDACNSTRTNNGSGVVSNGISYMPWQSAPEGSAAFGAITPARFWVLGNGAASSEITVTLRDGQGAPLAGKEVELETTVGTLQQPLAPTDAEGQTTAVISSTESGFATITAFNVTDNTPVPGTAGINFWQGSGDFGGLVDPGGTPYASPVFEVRGKPFQQGFPVEMRMPMQNSSASPVVVEVVYGVSGLNIGARFTPVYTATQTLQPGESWDARGVWVPDVTGHHCIQAHLSYNDGQQMLMVAQSGSGTRQINTSENPCAGLASGPGDFTPDRPKGGSGDLEKVGTHFKDQSVNLWDAIKCIDQEVNFRAPVTEQENGPRAYEVIVSVPQYTPPTIQPDEDLTAAQAEALNTLSQSSADLLGFGRAIAATRQRMEGAAQAGSLPDLDRQYQAYLDFLADYIQTLRLLADQHDDLLAVTEGAGVADAYFYPEDYETAFSDLKQNGFSSDTYTFLQQSNLSAGLIEELRSDIIEETEGQAFYTTSFYQVVRNTRDNALRLADRLERQYALGGGLQPVASTIGVTPENQEFPFTVSHQQAGQETVNLVIRPVTMPMDWSARLEQQSVSLEAGEALSNTLTLVPGKTIPEGSTVQLAVEGYIDGNYIGGILFTYNAPVVSQPRGGHSIYLPTIVR